MNELSNEEIKNENLNDETKNEIPNNEAKKCIPDIKHEIPITSYSSGKIILYIIYLILLISFLIYTHIDHENKNVKKKISSLFSSNEQNEFEKTLYIIVYGLLIMLISISVIYNIDYYNISYARTYSTITKPKYLMLLFLSSFIKSITFILISIIVILIRDGTIKKHFKFISGVASVIFLFDYLLETCGYNKWLDHENISKCMSPYNDISEINPSEDVDIQTHNMNLINISQKGDPFLLSFSKLSTTFIFGCLIFLIIKLFIITNNNSKNHKFKIPVSKFMLEIFVIGTFSILSLYLSLGIKKNNKEFMTKNNLLIGIIFPIILHIMFEYNDLYIDV